MVHYFDAVLFLQNVLLFLWEQKDPSLWENYRSDTHRNSFLVLFSYSCILSVITAWDYKKLYVHYTRNLNLNLHAWKLPTTNLNVCICFRLACSYNIMITKPLKVWCCAQRLEHTHTQTFVHFCINRQQNVAVWYK